MKIILLFYYFFISNPVSLDCPIEDGKFITDISHFVRGEGETNSIGITGSKGVDVFAITNGTVSKIGEKTGTVYVTNGEMEIRYFGIESNLKVEQLIEAGNPIGKLSFDFFTLSIKINGQAVDAKELIQCLE